jgi:hypothetical protein
MRPIPPWLFFQDQLYSFFLGKSSDHKLKEKTKSAKETIKYIKPHFQAAPQQAEVCP